MVCCVCLNCNSNDLKLSNDEKYLICNNCEDRQYIRDLEVGFEDMEYYLECEESN